MGLVWPVLGQGAEASQSPEMHPVPPLPHTCPPPGQSSWALTLTPVRTPQTAGSTARRLALCLVLSVTFLWLSLEANPSKMPLDALPVPGVPPRPQELAKRCSLSLRFVGPLPPLTGTHSTGIFPRPRWS